MKDFLKKITVQGMLCLYLGKLDKSYVLGMVEKAGRENLNALTVRAAVYRDMKKHYGDLTFAELNLVTDLALVLNTLEHKDEV